MVVLYLYCLYTIFVAFIPSTDVIQLSLTLKMTTAQVVETSVTVNNNSPIQDYVHPDDQTQTTFENFLLKAQRGQTRAPNDNFWKISVRKMKFQAAGINFEKLLG